MRKKLKSGSGRTTKKKITKPALMKAAEIVGGVTILSEIIEVGQGTVSTWLYTKIKIPAHHVPKIVAATQGQVRPEELRPDIMWNMPKAEE